MAASYKVLGQLNPSATTWTKLYGVPAATSAIVATLSVCNQAGSSGSFRLAIRVAGAADNAKQRLYHDTPIGANDSLMLTAGIALAATDELWVYASSGSISFNAWGQEIA